MRTKIVMFGSDPITLMADAQLLRDRGLLVISASNMHNVNELVSEVKPDVVFFDPRKPDAAVTEAYKNFRKHSNLPVILTVAEDDVYIVTRCKPINNDIALVRDNILDAVTIALQQPLKTKPVSKVRSYKRNTPNISVIPLFP